MQEISVPTAFRGELIGPSDQNYDEARAVWNGMIDKRPALIARCASTDDVVASVELAREHGLPVAVRGGGHNVAGNAVCDDGLVIDLSLLRAVEVDPSARTARAGPGLGWGELDAATQPHGLATPGGIVSTTGIAGFTLGGGIGWLGRPFGATCDNLLAAELVTADGNVLRAGPDENPDLYWALRGGGGNFGVVTSFEYRLHPVSEVLGGAVFYGPEDAAEALRFLREFMPEAPDELSTIAIFATPAALGRAALGIFVCHVGPLEEAEEATAPLRAHGRPLLDAIRPMPFLELQRQLDAANPEGLRNYWKAQYLDQLPDDATEAIAEFGARKPSHWSKFLLTALGGAAGRVGETETAFGHRSAPWILNINAMWETEPDDAAVAWARDFWDAVQPYSDGGTYVNFLGAEGEGRVRAAYGAETYDRLVELKTKYDPENFFRLNQNIRPRS